MSSTFTATASSLMHTRSGSSSTWNSGAFQGTYTGGYPRVGGILFNTLRNVNWSEQIIESIKLTLTFDAAGHRRTKKIGFYRGTRNTLSGTGTSFRGASIGTIATSSNAFDTTLTVSVTGAAFTRLVDMLQNSSINTLCTYTGEAIPGSDTYSENYLRINVAKMIITYTPKSSTGKLNKSSVPAGSAISLDITPVGDVNQSSLTHTVKWAMGSKSSTQSLAAGVLETEFTVPMDWLTTIPNAASGAASCTITTIANGVTRASRSYSFTVTAPNSAAPTFDAQIAVAGQVTAGYYQYLSAAYVRAVNASAQYGASIKSYSITGSEGASGSTSALTTAAFRTSGVHSYTVKVTDSRGKSASKTVECEVIAVQPPTIARFEVERYSAIQGDTISYVRTDYGPNVWFNIDLAVDAADGNNAAEAYILYGKVGEAERTRVDLPMEYSINVSQDRTIISGEISANDSYEFTLYLTDKGGMTMAYDLVAKGACILHRAGNGYGLGVGGFVTDGTEAKPLFKSFWEAQFQKDVKVSGALSGASGSFTGNLSASGTATLKDSRGKTLTGGELVTNTYTGAFSVANNTNVSKLLFTAPVTGLYIITATITWASNTNGARTFGIMDTDNSTYLSSSTFYAHGTGGIQQNATAIIRLTQGQKINARVWQNTGGALNAQWLITRTARIGA